MFDMSLKPFIYKGFYHLQVGQAIRKIDKTKELDRLSKAKLQELLLNGHITYREYIAEVDRLKGLRDRVFQLYLDGNISLAVMKDMLAELDRKDGPPEPPTIY
jgi:hypothetical protein